MTYSAQDNDRPVAGGFTRAELLEMSPDDMRAVMEGRKKRDETGAYEQRMGEAMFGQGYVAPTPAPASQDPYAVTAWGSNEEDFVAPSGQRCRLRKLDPKDLLEIGILDEVSRLPGLVQSGPIAQAQGKPPTTNEQTMLELLRDPKKFESLMGLMDKLVAYAVVRPNVKVWGGTSDREPGQVYTDMIQLGDRYAIMEHVMGAVAKLDSFRNRS